MLALFEAIKDRFETDDRLTALCRHVYLGTGEEQRTLPCVTVEIVNGVPMDTFDTDMMEWTVQFALYGGEDARGAARMGNMHDALRQAFDDAALDYAEWEQVGCEFASESGPNQDDAKVWTMTCDYTIRATRSTLTPAVRAD